MFIVYPSARFIYLQDTTNMNINHAYHQMTSEMQFVVKF